jgi:tripartite-type tricarboxylate transporter receptor subunit TctC
MNSSNLSRAFTRDGAFGLSRVLAVSASRVLALGAALAVGSASAYAADPYPDGKVIFVVAASAGGYADTVARVIADRLSSHFKQSFVVENRGGAGGNIAAKAVLGKAADGYTVLVTTTQLAINETLYKHKGFATGDLRPVSIPVQAPEVIVANPSIKAKTLGELIKSAGSEPLGFGSAGLGTGSYIEAQYLFSKIAKIKTVHIPYPGGAPAINDLLGNHIHVLAITVSPIIQAINRGSIRGLGIATPERMPFVPNVPTFAESGFPNYYASSWVGLFVSSKTPDAVVEKLNAAVNEAFKNPDVQARLKPFGVQLINAPVDKTARFFKSEVSRWGEMVRTLGIKVD